MSGKVTKFPEKGDGEGRLPGKDVLIAHESSFNSIKDEMDELRGDMGALVKNGDNDHNIHKKAFKLTMQLKRMTDDKRSAFWAHLDHYRDVFNLDSQLDLPLDDVAAQAAE